MNSDFTTSFSFFVNGWEDGCDVVEMFDRMCAIEIMTEDEICVQLDGNTENQAY